MAESNSTETVDLSSLHWKNWGAEGEPPVVMNRAASTHALIAWCWGEASVALELSITGTMIDDDHELRSLNQAMQNRLEGIVAVLNELGGRTCARKGQALQLVASGTEKGEGL